MTLYRKNGLRNFSIQDPTVGKKLQTGEVLAFSGTNNIKYTLFPGGIIGSDLVPTGVIAGTYGSSTMVPVITVDIFGRITIITEVPVSGGGGGISLETNGTPNPVQTLLNLVAGTNMTITDDGLGNITFAAAGGGGGSGTVTSVGAGTGMNFTTITTSGNVAIDTSKVPYLASGFTTGLLKWNGSAWVFDNSSFLSAGANISLLTNDVGFITAASLTPYLTILAAAAAYVPLSRTLTINGTSFDLSANRAWTISTTDYPYQRRTYYKAAQLLNLIRYNDLLYMVNASPTASGVLVVDRNTTDTTNTVVLAGGLYNQLITITGTDEIWNTSTNTSIQRYTASTGVFIANTAITGVITTAISTRFIQFSSTKVFMANSTNYFALNSSFVTTSLTAHGVGNIPYMAVNNNVSSAQNGHVMMGSTNGIMLINGTTNAVALSVTTLGGVLGPIYDIQYDSTNDWWIVVTIVGGNQRVIYLRPLTTTTFTVIETITEFNSAGTALAVGTGFTARIVFDAVTNVLFVVCNGTVFQYTLSTGELVKSFIYRFVGASGIIVSAEIDTTNKILYVASSVASQTLIHEFIYA